jgi:signal transduction histidine kinase
VVFAGGILLDPGYDEVLYELPGPGNCDGVLCVSGVLAQRLGRARYEEFLARYEPLPIVSVAVAVDAGPCVAVDDEGGMYGAVSHLIEQHGRRRIAFIRGPESSSEAERRLRAYRAALDNHAIGYDPELDVQGDFGGVSGAAAVEKLLARGRGNLDAVAAANDTMAAGAVRALGARGIHVPREICVVGFDDSENARFALPSLTTVRQPLHRLGWTAAQTLLEHKEHSLGTREIVLPQKLVVRDSCGCYQDGVPVGPGPSIAPPPFGGGGRAQSAGPLIASIRDVLEVAGVASRGLPERLLGALESDCGGASGDALLTTLREVLEMVPPFEATPWELRPIVAMLRRWVLPRLSDDIVARMGAETVLSDAVSLIGASARRAEAHRRFVSESRARSLSQVARGISGTAEMGELENELGPAMHRLHVQSCNVVLYDDPSRPLEGAKLVVRTEPSGIVRLPPQGAPFDPRKLLPSGYALEHGTGLVTVLPLSYTGRRVGFVTMEIGRDELSLATELANHIGSALARIAREREVARLETAERERSDELVRAARDLEDNEQRLLVSEKMAALGRLTAGMAQEMSLPLEAVRESFVELSQLAARYETLLDAPSFTPSSHEPVAEGMDVCVGRATEAAERVTGFVQGIKLQTRDLSQKEFTQFDAVPVIRDTLLLLNHGSRAACCELRIEPRRPSVEIFGSPGRLAQVVTNLVANAIDASRPKGGGPVTVRVASDETGVVIEVEDQGIGIAPEDVSRVFDPLFTTKPFGQGTGLGLSIVHNIVVGDLKGSIDVKSEVGQGTTVVVRLPAPPDD